MFADEIPVDSPDDELNAAATAAASAESSDSTNTSTETQEPEVSPDETATAQLQEDLQKAKKEAADYLDALQRERADFVNYRNRTAKEKDQYRAFGVQDVLKALLPALDDLDRINDHGKMTDDLKAVQKQLDRAFSKFQVTKFGVKGEEFDPMKHEAIMHHPDPTVTSTVIDAVVESGYMIGDRIVRAARVVVASPVEPETTAEASSDEANEANDTATDVKDSSHE